MVVFEGVPSAASGGLRTMALSVQGPGEVTAGDIQTGARILLRALEEPTRQIILNTGLEEAAVIVREIRKAKGNTGYDAASGEITDMVKAGIIDPAKVARTALQNAASVAGLMLTTNVVITDLKDDDKENATVGAVV